MGPTRLKTAVLLTAALIPSIEAAEPTRPRGVGPQFAKYYTSADSFSCIFNPSIKVPLASVNDDYCDCPDGSDEPGTSACAHVSPLSPQSTPTTSGVNSTLALPGFYCKNKGHIPSYIPFTAVNDGICDYELCCDGSDEFQGAGGVQCPDKCKEIGKEWRKADEERQRSVGAANKRKRELVREAQRLRKEVEDRIQTLETQIQGQEIKVAALEKELVEVERRERGKVVRASEAGAGGKLGVLVGLARQRIDELIGALSRVRSERDTSRERVKELEAILATFKDEYNPNFNDEGVKRAVRSWEDYAARDKGPDRDEAYDRDLDHMISPNSESHIKWEEYEGHDESSDTAVLYAFEEYLPASVRSWVDDKLRSFRITLIENGIIADPTSSSDAEPKAVTEARSQLDTTRTEHTNTKNSLQEHKDDLTKDYGPEDIFRAIKGQCIEKDSGEYTYELCFLDRTNQKPKKGGGHTGMGNYVGLDKIIVDEDLPADGKGLGSGERIVMKYENGQHCWNGPNRSTKVVLACAEKDEIWKITEEEKCVYRMDVGTPAVCEGVVRKVAGMKDEL